MHTSSGNLTTAVVVVDHGSRLEASNRQLEQVAALFRTGTDWPLVEPAHMELAEPSIPTAIGRCVAAGAQRILVFPWLLAPGRHWRNDIPAIVREAASRYADLQVLVTAPFGVDAMLVQLANRRILDCLQAAESSDTGCSVCSDPDRCRLPEPPKHEP